MSGESTPVVYRVYSMDYSLILSMGASILHLVAFGLYNAQMVNGTSKPNTATWTLWAVLTATNASAYFNATNDWVKSILPAASALACILTFLFAIVHGKFKKLSTADSVALMIGLVAGVAWWYYKSAVYANLLLQFSIATSFVPTYYLVWTSPTSEKSPPWALWGIAYAILTYVVFLRSGQWTDYVHPVQGAIMHAAVIPLTWRKT
jgi:hypothetical protein